MGLLNLHTHSKYSDGACSILELAEAYKKAGHIALCVTDHNYLLTFDGWKRACEEAVQVSKDLDFPIIVGLEVFLEGREEILIFGRSACVSLLTCNALESTSLFKSWYSLQKEPFAMVLAHPYLFYDDPQFYALMDGYEITNSGSYWGDDYVAKMQRLMPPPRRSYHGQDTHDLRDLAHRCNEVSEDLIIRTETELITYLSVKEWSTSECRNAE